MVLRDQHGVTMGDPPTNLKDLKALGFDPIVRHGRQPALNWKEAPDFMANLKEHEGVSSRALELCLLFAREQIDLPPILP